MSCFLYLIMLYLFIRITRLFGNIINVTLLLYNCNKTMSWFSQSNTLRDTKSIPAAPHSFCSRQSHGENEVGMKIHRAVT